MRMPEEQNRVLTDRISSLLFCPTQTAVDNLKKEGVTKGIHNTGDIMYDAVLRNIGLSEQRYADYAWLEELRSENGNVPDLREKNYYLATVHRAENTDELNKLAEIITAFAKLDKPVLLPLHPRTRKLLLGLDLPTRNITIIQPVGYLLMLCLTANAHMVLTDSGGLQKEAYFLKTPCTTLRDQTEWVETLENGWNVLAKIDAADIVFNATRPLECQKHKQPLLFGDGHAAEYIVQAILNGGEIQ
jgi:UDP-N-acetylglucosamine 2-epimerase